MQLTAKHGPAAHSKEALSPPRTRNFLLAVRVKSETRNPSFVGKTVGHSKVIKKRCTNDTQFIVLQSGVAAFRVRMVMSMSTSK